MRLLDLNGGLAIRVAAVSSNQGFIQWRRRALAELLPLLVPSSTDLIRIVTENPRLRLDDAVEQLNPVEQRQLREVWGNYLNELLSLDQENDPTIFFSGILNIGCRALEEGDSRAAAIMFQLLGAEEGGSGSRVPANLQIQARQFLAAMRGSGPRELRWRLLIDNILESSGDPYLLVGIGGAHFVSTGIRTLALSRLLASPVSTLLRPWQANMMASAAAFGPEVLTFWGIERMGRRWLNPRNLKLGASPVSELASLALDFGLLKLGGALFGRSFDAVHGICNPLDGAQRLRSFSPISRPLFEQAGVFSGIFFPSWLRAIPEGVL